MMKALDTVWNRVPWSWTASDGQSRDLEYAYRTGGHEMRIFREKAANKLFSEESEHKKEVLFLGWYFI